MPRRPILPSILAALTMAVAALCGGGKAQSSDRSTSTGAEIRMAGAMRTETRRRATDAGAILRPAAVAADNAGSDRAIHGPESDECAALCAAPASDRCSGAGWVRKCVFFDLASPTEGLPRAPPSPLPITPLA